MSLPPGAPPRALSTWLESALPAPQAWKYLAAHGTGGRTFWTRSPHAQYPDAEARLYRDAGDRLSFGLFRIGSGTREPVAGLRNVSSVEIHTLSPEPAPTSEPQALAIEIVGEAQEPIEAAAITALPERTTPNGRRPAWAFIDMIRLRTGSRALASVEVVEQDEAMSKLELESLLAEKTGYFLKYNGSQELRVQFWKAPAEKNRHPDHVFREVIGIRVVLREEAGH